MKTSELIGPALDWAVLVANGGSYWLPKTGKWQTDHGKVTEWIFSTKGVLERHEFSENSRSGHFFVCEVFSPSTDWAQGGPIIEKELIKVAPNLSGSWHGQIRHTKSHPLVAHSVLDGWTNQHGPTPLIAAMRCLVSSRLGEEVELPKELT